MWVCCFYFIFLCSISYSNVYCIKLGGELNYRLYSRYNSFYIGRECGLY